MNTRYTLPELPYAFNALEPYIDAKTMEIHHGKHHQAYVNNLNAALEKHPGLFEKPLENLLGNLDSVPEDIRTLVRNNGGGHLNHSMFWKIIGPGRGGTPAGLLHDDLVRAFGSFENFIAEFEKAAAARFGSGWAWLSVDAQGKLVVHSTANQDSPLMEGLTPIFGLDVWEHAYYLSYQNRRADYIKAFWKVVDWNAVSANYTGALDAINTGCEDTYSGPAFRKVS